jgi:hypothetical protein
MFTLMIRGELEQMEGVVHAGSGNLQWVVVFPFDSPNSSAQGHFGQGRTRLSDVHQHQFLIVTTQATLN